MSFIHLHLHTQYSLADGLIRIEQLAATASALNMPAIAVTEQGNLFSAIKFYKAMQEQGIKPIIGAELKIMQDQEATQLILLCQHIEGYRNLTNLITRSYQKGQQRGIPFVQYAWLKECNDGLIAISCAEKGVLGKALLAQNKARLEPMLEKWCDLFSNRYYMALQRIGQPQQAQSIHLAVEFAGQFQIPVVATNNVRFIREKDYEAHEARVCIHQGYTLNDPRRPRHYTQQQYLRSTEEMQQLFSDIPESIENSWHIAQRCNVEFQLNQHQLPHFPLPEHETQDQRLAHDANHGLQCLIEQNEIQVNQVEHYHSRLKTEIDVITNMGFAGYFLIVADFIQWAKQNNIPVGPGRGSGAGSLVAYALNITELDPLKYDLLFERFLNPERVSLPDFDIDFCMDRRDEVIDYVVKKYGQDHVSQIITYGSMTAKAVVRDVGRILGLPYGFVDKIAKLIPFDLNMTLTKALEEKELKQRYMQEQEVKTLIDLAQDLEGLCRNASRHAGGVVIAPKPLCDYMPLYCEQESDVMVSQFDMADVETVGLVKFDFLGLRTLTIIDWTLRNVNETRQQQNFAKIDIRKIPLDDSASYRLIQAMDTTAVFQLESDGMKKLVKRLKPDVFDDLIALVALFRPGPLQSGMVEDFIDRKHGKQKVEYMHDDLVTILKPTYGIILYQEQVMQIAQRLAGYTLGAADLLRRAMGKKKQKEMAEQRTIFTEGAVTRGVSQHKATSIFDLMEKFAGYGFNKSHSAAYALVAYQTAWLKAHYPAAFMAAVLSADMDNTDKVVMLLEDVRRIGIVLIPPSINQSQYRFTVTNEQAIYYGLGAIKGIGVAAIDIIVSERDKNGNYNDLFELCRRVDLHKVNRRVLEALIRSGSMDELGAGRSTLLHHLTNAVSLAEQRNQNNERGQDDLFGLDSNDTKQETELTVAGLYEFVVDWTDQERLTAEKETLGFYLSGHPLNRYAQELAQITSKLHDIKNEHGSSVRVAGYIMNIRRSGIRNEYEVKIDDNTARVVIVVNEDKYEKYRHYLIKDHLLIIEGMVKRDDYLDAGIKIIANHLLSIDDLRQSDNAFGYSCFLQLALSESANINSLISRIKDSLNQYRQVGGSLIKINYFKQDAIAQLQLGKNWAVRIDDHLINELIAILGKKQVKIKYNFVA